MMFCESLKEENSFKNNFEQEYKKLMIKQNVHRYQKEFADESGEPKFVKKRNKKAFRKLKADGDVSEKVVTFNKKETYYPNQFIRL